MKLIHREVECLRAGTATGEMRRVSVLDLEPKHAYVPVLLFFKRALPITALREALVQVLHHFPEVAGRLVMHEGEVHIHCADQGVRFEQVRRSGFMPDYGPGHTAQREFRTFLARKGFATPGRGRPLLDVCVTHFADGGAVLGVAMCHTLADGTALFAFLSAWAAQLAGEPYPHPSQSRARVEELGAFEGQGPTQHSRYSELSVWGFAKFVARYLRAGRRLEHAILRFDAERLGAMKAAANEALAKAGQGWVSTNDVLGAHLWGAFLKVGPAVPEAVETLTLIQSMRGLVDPPFEPHFMGNCATNTAVRGHGDACRRDGQAQLALRIRQAYGENDEARVRELLRFLCAQRRRGKFSRTLFNDVQALFDGHTLMLNDWSKFPIYALDFGGGNPSWFEIPAPPLPSFMLLAPTPEPGARDVHVVLDRAVFQPFVEAAELSEAEG